MIWVLLAISLALYLIFQRWENYRGRPELIKLFEIPEFQAHRGYHLDGTPENTLKSMTNAKRLGAQMVEMDVQISVDGEVFLYHDPDLQRLHGIKSHIDSVVARDLINLKITTLREVLESSEVPDKLNIELKTSAIFDGRLEKMVVHLIQCVRPRKKILFSSFNPFCLMRLRRLAPDIPRALIATGEPSPKNYFFLRHLCLVPFCSPDLLHLDQRMLKPQHLQMAKKYKLGLVVWTPNTEEEIQNLRNKGIHHFISDNFIMSKHL